MRPPVTLSDVFAAQECLRGVITTTPLQASEALSHLTGCRVWLKPENLQKVGAFKVRGAYNKIASLTPRERACGVVAHSSGNHAQAVAWSCRRLGVRAQIVMPVDAVPAKLNATRRYGAEVILHGHTTVEREAKAKELAASTGAILVQPFDDPLVIAGQGTIGLEVLADLPSVSTIIVPVGGGGLISGIAVAIKGQRPTVRVIGVEPEGAADARASLRQGEIVDIEHPTTIADGLRARHVGMIPFSLMRLYVDDVVTVSDDDIKRAVAFLLLRAKLVVEPSGAVPVAALLTGTLGPLTGDVVAILSGGNIDPSLIPEILTQYPDP
jgi:threonine dehydratase